MPISEFNVNNLATMRSDMNVLLAELGKKYGVKFNIGGGRYTADNVTFKVEAAIVRDGVVVDRRAADFKRYASLFDLNPEWLGKTIETMSGRFTITGLDMKKRKYPVIARKIEDDKEYKFPAEAVRRYVAKETK